MIINVPTPDSVVTDHLSVEEQSSILEGYVMDFLTADELLEFMNDSQEVNDNVRQQILTEKTIIRFDRAAQLSRAQKIAIFSIAKQHKDPLFKKLLTLWRMERYIEARLTKKYGNQAMRKARQSLSAASRKPTKSMKKVVDRAAIKAKRQLNAMKDNDARTMINKINV